MLAVETHYFQYENVLTVYDHIYASKISNYEALMN